MDVIETIHPENVNDLIKKIQALEELGVEYSISVYETKEHASIFSFTPGKQHTVRKYAIFIRKKGE